MYVQQPEQFETPDWVKHFIDFICADHSKGDWKKSVAPEQPKRKTI